MSDTGRKTVASVVGLATVGTIFAPTTATAVTQNVQTCITHDYNTTTAPCIKGGLADPQTHLTGATYTVETFKLSLADALTKATTANALSR